MKILFIIFLFVTLSVEVKSYAAESVFQEKFLWSTDDSKWLNQFVVSDDKEEGKYRIQLAKEWIAALKTPAYVTQLEVIEELVKKQQFTWAICASRYMSGDFGLQLITCFLGRTKDGRMIIVSLQSNRAIEGNIWREDQWRQIAKLKNLDASMESLLSQQNYFATELLSKGYFSIFSVNVYANGKSNRFSLVTESSMKKNREGIDKHIAEIEGTLYGTFRFAEPLVKLKWDLTTGNQ